LKKFRIEPFFPFPLADLEDEDGLVCAFFELCPIDWYGFSSDCFGLTELGVLCDVFCLFTDGGDVGVLGRAIGED
jgi:hypothetical protein